MQFDFVLKGRTPLLMHRDDIESADLLELWQKDPKNANLSKKGDDRTPPWRWKTYCYSDGERLTLPVDCLMTSLRAAGAELVIKGSKTFKQVTQTGLFIPTEHLPLTVEGKEIKAASIEAIEGDFPAHSEAVKKLGFRLFVKRAKVGQSKHIRVRPRFDAWEVKGRIEVLAEEITTDVLTQLFLIAGTRKGVCDWRPNSPRSPGPFGCFDTALEPVK